MKRFTDTLLWSMFDRNAIVPAVELQAALDIFITDLHSYCRSEKNMAERTRTLNYARHELQPRNHVSPIRGKNVLLPKILLRAVYFIECELRIITMELEHPERFISFPDDSGPLARWNGTIAELLEYTIPLQIAGRLSANSGEPLSYTDTVKLVEQIFGITISSPYDRKTKLLSRKKNDTPFLDKMRVVFREEAEKLHR